MEEYVWYQIQFLSASRVYEDCFERSENISEAISMLKKKRSYYGKNYRIVERKTSERIMSDKELGLEPKTEE